MADWTAITGIVVSGVVGPVTAAGFALWLQARGHRHADRSELRALLSEASVALRQAEGQRAVAGAAVVEHGQYVIERAREAFEALRVAGREVDLQSARIAVLLGEKHAVTVAHREALGLIDAAVNTLWWAPVMPGGKEVRDDWLRVLDVEPMRAARLRFVAEAHRLVGARLDVDPKGS